MKQPVSFLIRKKTLVPSRRQINHQWRSDWKLICKVDFFTAYRLFNYLNPNAPIVLDSQFANLIKDKFGEGTYSVIYYRKGKEGFSSLMKFECKDDLWCRLPKHLTKDDKEKMQLGLEMKRLKKVLKNTVDPNLKKEAEEELSSIADDFSLVKEIQNLTKPQSGPAPYLRSTLPIFKYHEYIDYTKIPDIKIEPPKKKEVKAETIEQEVEKQQEVFNEIW